MEPGYDNVLFAPLGYISEGRILKGLALVPLALAAVVVLGAMAAGYWAKQGAIALYGVMTASKTCPRCRGVGESWDEFDQAYGRCRGCAGQGRVTK